jgi:IS30 family transposase
MKAISPKSTHIIPSRIQKASASFTILCKYRGDDVLGRNYKQIDQLERDQIAIYRSKGHSFSEIGEVLGRNGSTISREYNRNITEEGIYLPSEAQRQSLMRKSQASERQSKCEVYESEIYPRLCEGWTPS